MDNLRDEAEKTPEKIYISWLDVDMFVNMLNDFILEGKFNGVYGPARGGLILAVMISHIYNLPFLAAPQKGCLIVDDIVDSGKTALCWKDKGYTIVSLCYNHNSIVQPDMYWKEKSDKWIIFPWEEIPSNESIDKADELLCDAINEAYPVWSSIHFQQDFNNASKAKQLIEGRNINI